MDEASLLRFDENPTAKICPFIFRALGAELIAVDICDDATSKPNPVCHCVAKSHAPISPTGALDRRPIPNVSFPPVADMTMTATFDFMELFFQFLVEWFSELAERRYGRLAGCIAVIVATALIVAGAWFVWKLLT